MNSVPSLPRRPSLPRCATPSALAKLPAAAVAFAVAIVLALTLTLPGGAARAASERQPLVIHTANGPHTFAVEVADTPKAREQGLMDRTRLGPRQGMLFDFKRPQQVAMWMHRTRIPLDMLFVDTRGRIVYIEHEAEPMSLDPRGPSVPVVAVVELAGGTARALGIARGDTLDHPMFDRSR